ncbi:unnamed protein product [Amoebophrya sp. A120]|nr:unnamed protein product [Amoebophrya sp. A120]|eukprot:GSA120T00003589001.1
MATTGSSCYALTYRLYAIGFWLVMIGGGLHGLTLKGPVWFGYQLSCQSRKDEYKQQCIQDGAAGSTYDCANSEEEVYRYMRDKINCHPQARSPEMFKGPYQWWDHGILLLIVAFFCVCEGYRGFQKMFSPMLIKRSLEYADLYVDRASTSCDTTGSRTIVENNGITREDDFPIAHTVEESTETAAVPDLEKGPDAVTVRETSGDSKDTTAESSSAALLVDDAAITFDVSQKNRTAQVEYGSCLKSRDDEETTLEKTTPSLLPPYIYFNKFQSPFLDLVLAPLLVGGFYYGSKRRLIVSWCLLIFILLCILVLALIRKYAPASFVPEFTNIGLVAGLGWGWISLLCWTVRAYCHCYRSQHAALAMELRRTRPGGVVVLPHQDKDTSTSKDNTRTSSRTTAQHQQAAVTNRVMAVEDEEAGARRTEQAAPEVDVPVPETPTSIYHTTEQVDAYNKKLHADRAADGLYDFLIPKSCEWGL